jgi:hypothetical protein
MLGVNTISEMPDLKESPFICPSNICKHRMNRFGNFSFNRENSFVNLAEAHNCFGLTWLDS